jgi:hypothetical protein
MTARTLATPNTQPGRAIPRESRRWLEAAHPPLPPSGTNRTRISLPRTNRTHTARRRATVGRGGDGGCRGACGGGGGGGMQEDNDRECRAGALGRTERRYSRVSELGTAEPFVAQEWNAPAERSQSVRMPSAHAGNRFTNAEASRAPPHQSTASSAASAAPHESAAASGLRRRATSVAARSVGLGVESPEISPAPARPRSRRCAIVPLARGSQSLEGVLAEVERVALLALDWSACADTTQPESRAASAVRHEKRRGI